MVVGTPDTRGSIKVRSDVPPQLTPSGLWRWIRDEELPYFTFCSALVVLFRFCGVKFEESLIAWEFEGQRFRQFSVLSVGHCFLGAGLVLVWLLSHGRNCRAAVVTRTNAVLANHAVPGAVLTATLFVICNLLWRAATRSLSPLLVHSAKLLPVMLGAFLLRRRRYSLWELCAAFLLLTGLYLFSEWPSATDAEEIWRACFAVGGLCICEMLVWNLQERVLHNRVLEVLDMVTTQACFGTLVGIVLLVMVGEVRAFSMMLKDPLLGLFVLGWSTSSVLASAGTLVLLQKHTAVTVWVVHLVLPSAIASQKFMHEPLTQTHIVGVYMALSALALLIVVEVQSERNPKIETGHESDDDTQSMRVLGAKDDRTLSVMESGDVATRTSRRMRDDSDVELA